MSEEVADAAPAGSDGKLPTREVEYCPKCDVPTVYCKFFGHVEGEAEAEGDAAGEPKPAKGKGKGKGDGADGKPNVVVTVKQRTKRKSTTSVSNLEPWGIDIKELSKAISKKMAIGCSTKKDAAGGLQIVIQGDAGTQIIEILTGQYKVPKGNIRAVRKSKQKTPEQIAEANQPPPQPGFDSGSDDEGDDDAKGKKKRKH